MSKLIPFWFLSNSISTLVRFRVLFWHWLSFECKFDTDSISCVFSILTRFQVQFRTMIQFQARTRRLFIWYKFDLNLNGTFDIDSVSSAILILIRSRVQIWHLFDFEWSVDNNLVTSAVLTLNFISSVDIDSVSRVVLTRLRFWVQFRHWFGFECDFDIDSLSSENSTLDYECCFDTRFLVQCANWFGFKSSFETDSVLSTVSTMIWFRVQFWQWYNTTRLIKQVLRISSFYIPYINELKINQ